MKVAQVGDSSVIAVQGPGDSLVFYWQPIGSQQWNQEIVAEAPLAVSPPSVAQVGNSTVIAVQGLLDTLWFYWQPIGPGRCAGRDAEAETVAASDCVLRGVRRVASTAQAQPLKRVSNAKWKRLERNSTPCRFPGPPFDYTLSPA